MQIKFIGQHRGDLYSATLTTTDAQYKLERFVELQTLLRATQNLTKEQHKEYGDLHKELEDGLNDVEEFGVGTGSPFEVGNLPMLYNY